MADGAREDIHQRFAEFVAQEQVAARYLRHERTTLKERQRTQATAQGGTLLSMPQSAVEKEAAAAAVTSAAEAVFQMDCYLELAEEMFTADTTFSVQNRVDERVWNVGFYASIEILRRLLSMKSRNHSDPTQRAPRHRLAVLLDRASGFFLWLVEHVRAQGNINIDRLGAQLISVEDQSATSAPDERTQQYAACLQRCFIYLGDLARY
ncbi:hypothetical protein THASP1DRAFT_32082, partial [Thamnocephalis sphaerospora]